MYKQFKMPVPVVVASTLVTAWNMSKIYLFWITMHYGASHAYPYFCAPNDVTGYLISPFLMMTPHCRGLYWMIQTSTLAIQNMWIIIGTTLMYNFNTVLPQIT